MFSTCIHCSTALGSNESIEAFPVGRRLAFDAALGRLWVVCRKCERWNLSPLDERWEAIEQGERAYRDTRVRVSTDNIGLARLRDGTELVRIGAPLRPEFAAWRYGDQFGRRQRRMIAFGAAATVGVGLGAGGMLATGGGIVALLPLFHLVNVGAILSSTLTHTRPMSNPEGGWFFPVGVPKLVQRNDVAEGWGIEIGYSVREQGPLPSAREWWTRHAFHRWNSNMEVARLSLRGELATPILRQLLPRINRGGAARSTVRESVAMIEQAGSGADFGRWAVTQRPAWAARQTFGDSGDLQHIPAPARLAFEMAIHEESERRALEGELALLEDEWRRADEIARIADGLLVTPAIEARVDALKKR